MRGKPSRTDRGVPKVLGGPEPGSHARSVVQGQRDTGEQRRVGKGNGAEGWGSHPVSRHAQKEDKESNFRRYTRLSY